MPQLDPTWFPNQLVWLAISFFLLYAVVAGVITPAITDTLTRRKRTIEEAIAAAEELKATASHTRGDLEAELTQARTKAAAMLAAAQAEAAKKAAEAQALLASELEGKSSFAAQSVAKAVAKARSNVDEAAADLAESMAAQLLGTVAVDSSQPVAKVKKA